MLALSLPRGPAKARGEARKIALRLRLAPRGFKVITNPSELLRIHGTICGTTRVCEELGLMYFLRMAQRVQR
jgi:hypothetical protein